MPGARWPTATGRLRRGARERWPPGSSHDVLRRLSATKDNADDYLYRLSLSLNVSQLGNVARARFAANVRLSLQRGSCSDALTVPLLDWVTGRISSEVFFERVIGD